VIEPKPFVNAKKNNPCPICGKTSWCGFNDEIAVCMRVPSDREVANGGWLHKLKEHNIVPNYNPPKPNPIVKRKPDKFLDRVYRDFISHLILSAEHKENLLNRGMTEKEIAAGLYRSTPESKYVDALAKKYNLYGVPGFFKEGGRWMCVATRGMLIPVLNELAQIVGFQIRLDNPDKNKKYVWFSSSNMGGSSPGPRIHVARPSRVKHPGLVWITEGPLKANISAERLGIIMLGVPGVNCWKHALPVLEHLNANRVVVAYDSDYHKEQVRIHARALVNEIRKKYKTGIALWHEHKGLDDALVAHAEVRVKLVS
jgi:hypothetical protein